MRSDGSWARPRSLGTSLSARERGDIPPVLEAALAGLRPAAINKGVEVESVVSPWVGPVLGDPERLQQIIGNIVANAIKYTPSGGLVSVQARNDATHVEILVSDTGQGISPDFLPHVFEAFRRAEGGVSGRQGGLGLGLAIVQHLVGLHNGTVRAESPGIGKGGSLLRQATADPAGRRRDHRR